MAKTVGNGSRAQIPAVLQGAEELLAAIPPEARDFDRAKVDVMLSVHLGRSDETEE